MTLALQLDASFIYHTLNVVYIGVCLISLFNIFIRG